MLKCTLIVVNSLIIDVMNNGNVTQEVRLRRTLPRRCLPTKRRTSFEVACMVFNMYAGLRPARHLRCDFHISFGCISFRLYSVLAGLQIQPNGYRCVRGEARWLSTNNEASSSRRSLTHIKKYYSILPMNKKLVLPC